MSNTTVSPKISNAPKPTKIIFTTPKGDAVVAISQENHLLKAAVMLPSGKRFGVQVNLADIRKEAMAALSNPVGGGPIVGWGWSSVKRAASEVTKKVGVNRIVTAVAKGAGVPTSVVREASIPVNTSVNNYTLPPADQKKYDLAVKTGIGPFSTGTGYNPGMGMQIATGKMPFKVTSTQVFYYNKKTKTLTVKPNKPSGLVSAVKSAVKAGSAAVSAANKVANAAGPIASLVAPQLGVAKAAVTKVTAIVQKAREGSKPAIQAISNIKQQAERGNKMARKVGVVAVLANKALAAQDSRSSTSPDSLQPNQLALSPPPAADAQNASEPGKASEQQYRIMKGNSYEEPREEEYEMEEQEPQESQQGVSDDETVNEGMGMDDERDYQKVGATILEKLTDEAKKKIVAIVVAASKGDAKSKLAIAAMKDAAAKGAPVAVAAYQAATVIYANLKKMGKARSGSNGFVVSEARFGVDGNRIEPTDYALMNAEIDAIRASRLNTKDNFATLFQQLRSGRVK